MIPFFNGTVFQKLPGNFCSACRLRKSKQIFDWLIVQNWKYPRKWKVLEDNPCIFFSTQGEAIYIYDNLIKYYEDIRLHHNIELKDFEQLQKLLTKKYIQ